MKAYLLVMFFAVQQEDIIVQNIEGYLHLPDVETEWIQSADGVKVCHQFARVQETMRVEKPESYLCLEFTADQIIK